MVAYPVLTNKDKISDKKKKKKSNTPPSLELKLLHYGKPLDAGSNCKGMQKFVSRVIL